MSVLFSCADFLLDTGNIVTNTLTSERENRFPIYLDESEIAKLRDITKSEFAKFEELVKVMLTEGKKNDEGWQRRASFRLHENSKFDERTCEKTMEYDCKKGTATITVKVCFPKVAKYITAHSTLSFSKSGALTAQKKRSTRSASGDKD